MSRRPHLALPLALLALSGLCWMSGCTPKIGDACELGTDCAATGDRLCDRTLPGGYCTIFNCEPGTCPEDEGVCVAFDAELDPACGALNASRPPRFLRTFCMAPCASDEDCREGYVCAEPKEQGAQVVDKAPTSNKVCLRATPSASGDGEGGSSSEAAAPPGICGSSTATVDDLPPASGQGGQGGASSSEGGQGGAGGGGGG